MDKKSVEERFLKALDGPTLLDEDTLAPMRAVLSIPKCRTPIQMIFTAFA